ncbi:MiaB/RimO family radical SAM methylthiotransferase [candidate division WWE3 bacterium]|jgi:tRNA-2-methylthio-N6-dimethylallyladenosine synthase|uniref:MiaB/RimO family radical SAM methylthiotransferase n=1 Tax=candidate division WWE3 bacterium TaxID=2053526 RepID=A0A3A4ZCH0_UNCKA|nr:MAG: MiaB/RimO family radical SAM methylthiotransferase [candidate division WWE3 bacterium]
MNIYIPRKYHIKTFGCQANIADSGTLSGILESLGYEYSSVEDAENENLALIRTLSDVDLFVINTCSVRQKSEDKVYGIGKAVNHVQKEKGSRPFIVMAGCMVGSVTGERQRYEFDELRKKTPWVDLYINPSQIFDLPLKLQESHVLDEWAVQKFDPAGINSKQEDSRRAFVNISYGCDNFCTFCVVPYARGREVSRTEADILAEINHLVKRGKSEFTLCGQNVNSWGLSMSDKFEIRTGSDDKTPFADLLRKIHSLEEVEKIDFISSNPFDFTSDLIETLKLQKISNYLHIAVQSGNNDVLKKMNRRHSIEDFYSLVESIKQARPEIELGTDLIVGFPGETEEQFLDTIELVKKIKFNVAFIAMYSPRKGTPAQKFYPDDVPAKEKKRRHKLLTEAWKKSKDENN